LISFVGRKETGQKKNVTMRKEQACKAKAKKSGKKQEE